MPWKILSFEMIPRDSAEEGAARRQCVKGHKRGPCFCTGFCESLSAKQVEVRGGRGGQSAVTARALNYLFPVRQGRQTLADNG